MRLLRHPPACVGDVARPHTCRPLLADVLAQLPRRVDMSTWRVTCEQLDDGHAGTFDTLAEAEREIRDTTTPWPDYGWHGCAGPHTIEEVDE